MVNLNPVPTLHFLIDLFLCLFVQPAHLSMPGVHASDRSDHLHHLQALLAADGAHYTPTATPARLLGHVYLGNLNNAESYPTLRNHGITHVLNCAAYKGRRSYSGTPYPGLGIDYVEIFADDVEGYDITQHFTAAFRYLDRVKQAGGTALVHCAMGINRSAAICAGYLLDHLGMPLIQAIRLLKDKRRVVLTNNSFVCQLYDWSQRRGQLGSQQQWHNSILTTPTHSSGKTAQKTDPQNGAAADKAQTTRSYLTSFAKSSPRFDGNSNGFVPALKRPTCSIIECYYVGSTSSSGFDKNPDESLFERYMRNLRI